MSQVEFTGSVLDERGNVRYAKVRGYYTIQQKGVFKTWDGVMNIDSDEPISIGETCQLVMDDGKQGPIALNRWRPGSTRVEFGGLGAITDKPT